MHKNPDDDDMLIYIRVCERERKTGTDIERQIDMKRERLSDLVQG